MFEQNRVEFLDLYRRTRDELSAFVAVPHLISLRGKRRNARVSIVPASTVVTALISN